MDDQKISADMRAETDSNSEQEFLNRYDSSVYEKVSIAVDLLVFTIEDDTLKILMIRRAEYPFKGYLALPGVFVKPDESLDEAAQRGIREETGLGGIYLEQMYTFGEIARDPRSRVISVSYMALVPREELTFHAGERASETLLVPVSGILDGTYDTAFDHKAMIEYGKWRLKNKVEYTDIAFHFVPELFTLPQLQRVHEILLDRPLFKANFRKKINPMIEKTDIYTSGDAHRPSQYYRRKENAEEQDNQTDL